MSPRHTPLEERLLARIDVRGPNDCWPWTGCVGSHGYGAIGAGGRGGKVLAAPAVLYEMFVEPLADGEVPDHLCLNRRCMNLDHLERVTSVENNRRGALHRWHGTTFWPEMCDVV